MLEYVEKITLAPETCTEDDVHYLRGCGFADEDIFDIVMLAAYRSFVVRVADALGVQLPAEFSTDQRIVQALATGKSAESISAPRSENRKRRGEGRPRGSRR